MKLFLAIMWTIYFILCSVGMAAGIQPSWLSIFGPLICLTAQRWEDYFDERKKQ